MRLKRRKRIERRKAKTHRNRYVNLRLTARELDGLKAKAKAARMSVSELLRDHVGRVRITPRPERREILLGLARIASGLQDLARWASAEKGRSAALKVCFRLVEVGTQLRAIEDLVANRGAEEEAAS